MSDYELMGYDDDDDELEGDELLGYDDDNELLGDEDDDDDELLGRRRRRGRGRKRKVRRVLRRRGYSRERGLVLGFDSQAIPVGATVDFSANPQVPFRPKRIIIGATVIGTLLVEDIKVGKNSMLVTAGGFPAIGFAGNTFDQAIKFDTAVPGIDIVVTVTNQDAAINTTAIGMYGVAAER